MNNKTEKPIVLSNINCWEFMKCGREPGGINSESEGVCPTASNALLDKTNNGKNGGRICWYVDGTNCMKKISGEFIDRFEYCQKCSFYLLVQKQENRHLVVVKKAIDN